MTDIRSNKTKRVVDKRTPPKGAPRGMYPSSMAANIEAERQMQRRPTVTRTTRSGPAKATPGPRKTQPRRKAI
jgi:hypothetical protein